MTTQTNFYTKPTLRHEIFSSGVLNQNYLQPSAHNISNNDSLHRVVVSAAALTCFLATPVHATEVNTARKSQYLEFDYQAIIDFKPQKPQKVFLYGGVSKTLSWLESFYETSEHADTAKQLLPLISGIKQLFADKQYSLVNDILLEIKLHKLSSAAKVAFISAAYPARNMLDNWSLSVDKVKSSLTLDGLDPDKILNGLI